MKCLITQNNSITAKRSLCVAFCMMVVTSKRFEPRVRNVMHRYILVCVERSTDTANVPNFVIVSDKIVLSYLYPSDKSMCFIIIYS